MTDTPWSNRQQQMVQEYLDALLTDPEAGTDAPETATQVLAEPFMSEEADRLPDTMMAEPTDTGTESEEAAVEVSEMSATADECSAEQGVEPFAEEGSSVESVEMDADSEVEVSEYTGPEEVVSDADAEAPESVADDLLLIADGASEAAIETDTEALPENEEALDAALHAIESVKAAEAEEELVADAGALHEADAAFSESPQPVSAVEETLTDLPEDLAADDGVSTIEDPISVAAELLHEELDQYDADPFAGQQEAPAISVLQDIPEIATEPEALLPVDDSVLGMIQQEEISASADLDAYVEDITNMQPVAQSVHEEHHEEHDITALLSQLAEIVSDDSVAEAVIQKIEEIAQEFSSQIQVQDVIEPEPESEPEDALTDTSEDILEAVDAVVSEEEINFDLGEDPLAEVDEGGLSDDELAAEFAAAMAAEADMDANEVQESVTDDISEIEFPAELEDVVSEAAPAEVDDTPVAAAIPDELQCIIVEMHGLQLAMPLEHVLEPRHIADMSFVLDDQYDWVLGSFLDLNFKIDVVDTAMWLIPETYEPHNATYDEILLLQDKPWALTYDKMISAQIISMDEVTLNTDKSRRPWLLGTSMTHKCAIVDIPALCKQLEEAL